MSTAVLNPPKTVSPPAPSWKPFRWTISEYRDLDKTGLFHDVKTMLLDGEIFVMAAPSPPHDVAMVLTETYLRRAFTGTNTYLRNQMGFDIGKWNDPSPDLAVVGGSIRDHATRTPTEAILIVEVAVTSLATDTTTKAELYASAEVPEYWVIDVPGRELHLYRDPVAHPEGLGADAYRTRRVLKESDSLSPMAASAAVVKVSDLLP
ncbi:MAG: Uma2 family endonuclease [Gemmataceae bacterium]